MSADANAIRLRVVDLNGNPVEHARIVLLRSTRSDEQEDVDPRRSTGIESQPTSLTTDDSGSIELSSSELRSTNADVVLVLAAGFEAAILLVDDLIAERVAVIELAPRPLTVQVQSENGETTVEPVVRVQHQFQYTASGESRSVYFTDEYRKDAEAPVMVSYSRWACVSARAGELATAIVRVDDELAVDLVLRATFGVRFSVARESAPLARVNYIAEALVGGEAIGLQRGVARLESGLDEVLIPYVGPYRYSFACQAGDWSSAIREIERPTPGASYNIQFVDGGNRSWSVIVVDEDSLPIPDSLVACTWTAADGGRQRLERTSDVFGRVRFDGLPDALVDFWARKPGYFQIEGSSAWTNFTEDAPVKVRMARGCELRGRVSVGANPATEFTVWYCVSSGAWSARSFIYAKDGFYRIRGLPAGKVEVVVSSPVFGQSRPEIVAVEIDEPSVLNVSLSPAGSARCTVVDSQSGLAVRDAGAEILIYASGSAVGSTGFIQAADENGRIELRGVALGTCRVAIAAPGYERTVVSGFVGGAVPAELGVIRLRRTRSLRLSVVSDGPIRLDWCSVSVVGGVKLPRMLLSSTGAALLSGVAPGLNRIEITRADSSEEVVVVDIGEAGPTELEIPISTIHATRVELSPDLIENAAGAELFYDSKEGWRRSTYTQSDAGGIVIAPVESSRIREIELIDRRGTRIVRREVTEAERLSGVIKISAGSEMLVRVVDRRGNEIQGCSVIIRRANGDPDVVVAARTDDLGVANATGIGWESIDVMVFHSERGVRASERVDTRELAGRTLELELDPIGRARVAVRDGEVAIAGVQVRFLDPKYNAGRAMTDEEGVAWSLPLQEGKYRAEVGQSGYWPAAIDFECDKEEVWRTLQVRRTGGLDLEIQSASGRDVRSYVLELRSKEFEKPVAEWLGAGKVVSPQGGRPDKDGRLEVYGLPNGEYTWTAILDGAGVMAGEIEVGPHSVNKKKLFLP